MSGIRPCEPNSDREDEHPTRERRGEDWGDDDNWRQASSLIVGNSSSIAAGTLALGAALVGITTYVGDKYKPGTGFYVVAALGGVALAGSLLLAAHGTARIARDGSKGKWKVQTERKLFNWQTRCTALAGLLLAVAVVIGLSSDRRGSDNPTRGELRALVREVEGLKARVATLEHGVKQAVVQRRELMRLLRRAIDDVD